MRRDGRGPALLGPLLFLALSAPPVRAQTPAPVARPATAAVLAPAAPESVGLSRERLARMRRAMQDCVDRGELAGAVMLIARDGRLAELSAVGHQDRERGVGMRIDALFRIASQTKAAQLVPADREITIRDLLTHRAGITYGFADKGPVGDAYRKEGVTDGLASPEVTLADNMARLARAPLVSQPGREYRYGLNTDVLGRLVEVVSGQSLAGSTAARTGSTRRSGWWRC